MEPNVSTPQNAPMPAAQPAQRSLLGFVSIIKEVWNLFKMVWGRLILFVGLPGVVSVATGLIIGLPGVFLFRREGFLMWLESNLAVFVIIVVALVVAFVILNVFVLTRSIIAAIDVMHYEGSPTPLTFGQAWKNAKGRVKGYFWTTVLLWLVLMGGLTFLIIPALVGLKFLPELLMMGSFAAGTIITVSFIVFLIPCFILLMMFAFGVFFNAIDREKGVRALAVSAEHTKGFKGKIFLNYVIFGLIMIVCGLIVGMIEGFIPGKSDDGLINFLWQTLSSSFGLVFAYTIWKRLKFIKAGVVIPPQARRKQVISWATVGLVAVLAFLVASIVGAVYAPRVKYHSPESQDLYDMQ